MFSLKKIQLCVVLMSLIFLSLVKQTNMTEMPSLAKNSNRLDKPSIGIVFTEEEVSTSYY